MTSDVVFLPCLILGFNRLEPLESLIKQLQRQLTPRIYISLDGPRNFEDQEIQKQIELMIQNISKNSQTQIFLYRRDSNLGLRHAVIQGVDWFFENEECGVVLEDDLVLHPLFQEYFSKTLSDPNVRKKIMTVSGNQFIQPASYGLIQYPLIWGWGTWRENWMVINQDILDPKPINTKTLKYLARNGFINAGVARVNSGILNSWAITFVAASLRHSWLHLVPPFALVANVGDDQYATHTFGLPSYASDLQPERSSLPKIPSIFEVNDELEKFILKFHYGIRFRNVFSPIKAKVECGYKRISDSLDRLCR